MTCRLSEFVMTLISLRTEASARLAEEVYRAACRAWQTNRRDLYGELNMTDPMERQTVRAHGELIDAIAASAEEEWPEFIEKGGAK